MVSVEKYYVYGGGRWREVDTGSGRIDGWGRAKFLVARNGKLEATRSRPVLAALRALADKTPSAAKEGPQLSYKYPRQKSLERLHPGCEHQCCHHITSGSCTSKSDKKASIAIQCNKVDLPTNAQTNTHYQRTGSKTAQNSNEPIISTKNVEKTENSIRKRKRSTSSEDLFHTKVVTVATVHSPRKPDQKRRRNSIRKPRDDSTSSDDSKSTVKLSKQSPRLQLRRPRPLKRKRSSSEASIILKSKSERLPKKVRKNNLNDNPRSARKNYSIVITDDSDFDNSSDGSKTPNRKRSSSTDVPLKGDRKGLKRTERTDNLVKRKLSPKKNKKSSDEIIKTRLGPKQDLESLKDEQIKSKLDLKSPEESSTDEPIKRKPGQKRSLESSKNESIKRRLGPKKTTENSSTDDAFIQKKTQESFKQDHKLGPKRTTERSLTDESLKPAYGPKLTRPSGQTTDGKISSQKELRTNERYINNSQDASKELLIDERDVEILRIFLLKHYPDEDLIRFDTDDEYKKMHFYRINPLVYLERCPRIARMIRDSQDDKLSLVDFASKLGLRSVSEASSVKRYRTRKREEKNYADTEEFEKENDIPSKVTHKVESVRREREDRRVTGDTVETVDLSSDSEKEVEKKVSKKPKAKVVSKRPPLNEYSNLEDHAIVSWVSVGGRACSVNGNRIWRELQDQFQKITGHERTWHSLRNRYLRYILPCLGALALPPSLQTRLRAAAATGEMKAKRRANKRNSIFKPAVRGAASRRPARLERDETREESEKEENEHSDSPPRTQRAPTPRYSDVTRQFAQKHRYSSERSSSHGPQKSRRLSPDKSSNKSSRKSMNTSERIKASEKNSKSDKKVISEINKSKSKYENSEKSSDSSSDSGNKSSPKRNKQSEKSRHSVSESRNNRHNSPIAKSRNSMSDKSRKNTLNHKPNKIKRKQSPSPRRNSYKSPSDSSDDRRRSRRDSGDTGSDSDSNDSDLSKRKSYRLRSSIGSPSRKSISPTRRRSNRIIPPDRINSQDSQEANRLIRNRIKSPKSDRRKKISDSSSPELKRKSNVATESKHRSNRSLVKPNKKSPEESNRRSRNNSPIETRRKLRDHSLSESRRKRADSPESGNSRRRSNRYKSEIANLESSIEISKLDKDRTEKREKLKRTRKLFNPKDII